MVLIKSMSSDMSMFINKPFWDRRINQVKQQITPYMSNPPGASTVGPQYNQRKKKSFHKKKGKYAQKVLTIRGVSLVPDAIQMKMNFADIRRQALVGGKLYYYWVGNDIYHPDTLTASRGSALGFDKWNQLYYYWVVFASKIKLTIKNLGTVATDACTFAIFPDKIATTATTEPGVRDAIAKPYSKSSSISFASGGANESTVYAYMGTKKQSGGTNPLTDITYWGTNTGSPSATGFFYWNLVITDDEAGVSTAVQVMDVKITYYVRWFNRAIFKETVAP